MLYKIQIINYIHIETPQVKNIINNDNKHIYIYIQITRS